FPQCCPPNTVSRRADVLRAFIAEHGDVILKPLDGMGGSMIFRVRQDDPNVSVIIEALTQHGTQQIMAQRYLPEIIDGDKRILMIDGEPVPYCLARIPQAGETRGNLAAGGRGEARPLSDRDRWIAAEVGPELRRRGLLFVGLDVIGDYLTEINVTSPTCIREIDAAYDTDIGGKLMDIIAEQLEVRRGAYTFSHRRGRLRSSMPPRQAMDSMNTAAMPPSTARPAAQPAIEPRDRLGFTLFLAAVLHALIVLGITFDLPDPSKLSRTLEITLASQPSETTPEDADYLAQFDQEGSGTLDDKAAPSTPEEAVFQDSEI